MSTRRLQRLIPGQQVSDGAGVRLNRTLGQSAFTRLDPFLMLDEFSSFDADDYLAGFPSHPHRGFETVTYMLDGHMLHEDHLGNRGDLTPGAVQWMTAGRGIIHSEMPQQHAGRMRGFQLWINLPAKEKMTPARYRDIAPEQVPCFRFAPGVEIKLIAGRLMIPGGDEHAGPINGDSEPRSTDPFYADVDMAADSAVTLPVKAGHAAFLYVFEGTLTLDAQPVPTHSAAVLSDGERITVHSGHDGARFLLLAGRPLKEPVVQYGPFVMNSSEEIEQALRDYRQGVLTD